jgi:peroxiredoxin
MNLNKTLPLALILALTGSFAFGSASVGDAVPSFEATTLDGQRINSSDLKNNSPMLIVFWASWCPYCVRDVPKLNRLFSNYGSKGLVMLAINPGVNDSIKRIEQFVKNHGAAYPIAFDEGSTIARGFGIFGAPTYFLVDKSGVVRYRGNELPEEIEKLLDSSLAAK